MIKCWVSLASMGMVAKISEMSLTRSHTYRNCTSAHPLAPLPPRSAWSSGTLFRPHSLTTLFQGSLIRWYSPWCVRSRWQQWRVGLLRKYVLFLRECLNLPEGGSCHNLSPPTSPYSPFHIARWPPAANPPHSWLRMSSKMAYSRQILGLPVRPAG